MGWNGTSVKNSHIHRTPSHLNFLFIKSTIVLKINKIYELINIINVYNLFLKSNILHMLKFYKMKKNYLK